MKSTPSKKTSQETKWNWRPQGPVENNPLFLLPIDIRKLIKWYAESWKPLSEYFYFTLLSLFTWSIFQPELHDFTDFHLSSAFAVYGRNLVLTVMTAGGLHLYFYTFQRQGLERKYETRGLVKQSKLFTFNNQIYDNIFWTLASGVTIWTGYEVILYWALANNYAPFLAWPNNKFWFIALFPLIPVWISLHFYLGHKLLHWPPLYRISHAIHHRNITTGPWSGLSMHPIEHLIYLSSLLIHFFIPSHPIHIMFHAYGLTLSAIIGHVGYDSLLFKGRPIMAIGHFHHQLHHRHFECNYGAVELPCDVWFDSFDDGSASARQRLKEKTKARTNKNKSIKRKA